MASDSHQSLDMLSVVFAFSFVAEPRLIPTQRPRLGIFHVKVPNRIVDIILWC
jgi:hypothetical protein